MKNIILKILLFILYSSIGLVLAWLSERLSSNFLEKFYKSNFLALLISLTALLFAIYSLITNRLLELAKKSKYAFETTQSERKHSKKCTFYTLRFGCSFAAVNTIKPQLL